MTDLQPCPNPWCDHASAPTINVTYDDGLNAGPYYVMCFECGTEGPNRSTEAEAVEAWHTRAPPTSTDERKDVLDAEKIAFTFAFAAGFKCADETSRQCASAMDDAWDDYRAVRALTTKGST